MPNPGWRQATLLRWGRLPGALVGVVIACAAVYGIVAAIGMNCVMVPASLMMVAAGWWLGWRLPLLVVPRTLVLRRQGGEVVGFADDSTRLPCDQPANVYVAQRIKEIRHGRRRQREQIYQVYYWLGGEDRICLCEEAKDPLEVRKFAEGLSRLARAPMCWEMARSRGRERSAVERREPDQLDLPLVDLYDEAELEAPQLEAIEAEVDLEIDPDGTVRFVDRPMKLSTLIFGMVVVSGLMAVVPLLPRRDGWPILEPDTSYVSMVAAALAVGWGFMGLIFALSWLRRSRVEASFRGIVRHNHHFQWLTRSFESRNPEIEGIYLDCGTGGNNLSMLVVGDDFYEQLNFPIGPDAAPQLRLLMLHALKQTDWIKRRGRGEPEKFGGGPSAPLPN